MKNFGLLILSLFISHFAYAENFNEFSMRVKNENESSREQGLSYMVSGSVALVGGTYGWSHSEKSVEKGFYSLAQSVGILAIGFGAEAYFLRQDEDLFLQVLNSVELTMQQKDKMVTSYLKEKTEREEQTRWIRRTTFGLAGLLNAIYASQTKDQTLQNFLFVTSGIQLVWAFTF